MESAETEGKPNPGTITPEPAKGGRALWKRPVAVVLGTVVLGWLLFWGLGYMVEAFTHESTDDAFLDAHVVSVAPKVSGRVSRVPVGDNQAVRAGDLLVELEPEDLQVQLDQKRAALKAAQENVNFLKASLSLSRAQVTTAQATAKQTAAEAAASRATAERARSDLQRAQALVDNHTISPQEFDTAKAAATSAEASFHAAQEKAASDQAKVAEAEAQAEASQSAIVRGQALQHQADGETHAAELTLSYARVTAPEDGWVTKRSVSAGDYVQAGQALLALVPNRMFITANFKETQLRNIRTNQPVRVIIDAVAKRTFRAHVDSVMAGSGARFSLLPPENAVGNYVKVVQRVPVKIVLDEPLQTPEMLGPGMSVTPSIHTSSHEISETARLIASAVLALLVGLIWWMAARKTPA